jgi:hypothetical protein
MVSAITRCESLWLGLPPDTGGSRMELDELHEGVNRSLSKIQVRSLGFCGRISQTRESDAATAADRVAHGGWLRPLIMRPPPISNSIFPRRHAYVHEAAVRFAWQYAAPPGRRMLVPRNRSMSAGDNVI